MRIRHIASLFRTKALEFAIEMLGVSTILRMRKYALLLENDESQLDVLIITEWWLDDTVADSEIYIPGDKIERKDKNGKVAGGVLMYISSHITYCQASRYESSDL